MYSLPTSYDGIDYRSRLEAKWAMFFDLVGLSFLYESKDLHYYNPDFIINGDLLAEVKGCSATRHLEQHVAKIKASGWTGPWVLLGEHQSVQLGHRIEVANADVIWKRVCNELRWFNQRRPEYAKQTVSFDTNLFSRRDSEQTIAYTQSPISLPVMPTYALQEQPRTTPSRPTLPAF